MNKVLKTTLVVGGTAAATLIVANVLTDGAVMDAIKEKIHPAAEAVADAAVNAAEAVEEATAQ
ncbi:MAG: hypothetical protein NC548_05910 [Lachnospiraceae bacterium]|nr:hypothetical protein [Lachnospiraceae bacterium]